MIKPEDNVKGIDVVELLKPIIREIVKEEINIEITSNNLNEIDKLNKNIKTLL